MTQDTIRNYMFEIDRKWTSAGTDSPWVEDYLSRAMSVRLKGLMREDKSIAEIYFTDRQGGLVASSERTDDFYQADEDWWKKAYDRGRGSVYVGGAEPDRSSGVLNLPLAVPVQGPEGRIIGILRESLALDKLFLGVCAHPLGRDGYAVLIDGKGRIIFHEGAVLPKEAAFGEEKMEKIEKFRKRSFKEIRNDGPEKNSSSALLRKLVCRCWLKTGSFGMRG